MRISSGSLDIGNLEFLLTCKAVDALLCPPTSVRWPPREPRPTAQVSHHWLRPNLSQPFSIELLPVSLDFTDGQFSVPTSRREYNMVGGGGGYAIDYTY